MASVLHTRTSLSLLNCRDPAPTPLPRKSTDSPSLLQPHTRVSQLTGLHPVGRVSRSTKLRPVGHVRPVECQKTRVLVPRSSLGNKDNPGTDSLQSLPPSSPLNSSPISGQRSTPPVTPDPNQPPVPTPRDAFNWFCITVILLISLTDFTPLGSALQSASDTSSNASSAPWVLGLVQWLFFVAPTVSWAKDCNFSLTETFKLKPCSLADLGMGALGGVASWGVVAALLSFKNGTVPPETAAAAAAAYSATLGPSPTSPSDLIWYAASPAAAEEILFRGFVLSALSTGFGRVDSVMLAGAMFGAFHLNVSQLFPTMVLGITAGFVTLSTGSVFPAIALHFANNAAAILLGGVGPLGA